MIEVTTSPHHAPGTSAARWICHEQKRLLTVVMRGG
jgi:hypothetical protein